MRKVVSFLAGLGIAAAIVGGHAVPVIAGKPIAAKVRIILLNKTSYAVEVTVQHEDTSWDHYVDRWEIIGLGGKVIGTRVLYHPHIGEPHFTRSLRGITIPEGTNHVIIRVHDKIHGYGRERLIALPTEKNRDTGYQ